ncbi:hypothetical protein [Methanosphaerula subterraneus]
MRSPAAWSPQTMHRPTRAGSTGSTSSSGIAPGRIWTAACSRSRARL